MAEKVRIDKWLWAVRIFKTRSLASDAIKSGKVKFDGNNVKTSKEVKIGEVYEITIGQLRKTIQVKAILDNRVSAKFVEDFMIDLTPEEEYNRVKMIYQGGFEHRDRGSGRPTKRERREIEEFKYK